MYKTVGLPTFFGALPDADLHWPALRRIIAGLPDGAPRDPLGPDANCDREKAAISNPHISGAFSSAGRGNSPNSYTTTKLETPGAFANGKTAHYAADEPRARRSHAAGGSDGPTEAGPKRAQKERPERARR